MVSLVTGASGLLGRSLVNELSRRGLETRALIRNPDQAKLLDRASVTCVVGDLTDRPSLDAALRNVDTVYHCAATSTDWAPWDDFYSANVIGVENLVNATAEVASRARFIHVSSTDVYGFPKTVVDEEAPMVDVGLPYNRTKILGEKIVQRAYANRGLAASIARPATIYGPRSSDFVVEVYEQLKRRVMPVISGGHTSPGLIFVDNAANALIDIADCDDTIGRVYNLRDECAQSWKTYLTALAESFELPPPRFNLPFRFAFGFARTAEYLHSRLSLQSKPLLTRHAVYLMSRDAAFPIDRAQEDFGFCSSVSFEQGIECSVNWLKERHATGKRQNSGRGLFK